jgi:hypothetical protein
MFDAGCLMFDAGCLIHWLLQSDSGTELFAKWLRGFFSLKSM